MNQTSNVANEPGTSLSMMAVLKARYEGGLPERFDAAQEATVIGAEGEDFGYGAICTSHARYIASKEPNTRVMGFFAEKNPCAMSEVAEGHDFAVIDGRYIVDTWLHGWEQQLSSPVLDMQNDADKLIIQHWYGNPEHWEEVVFNVPPSVN